MPMMATLRDMFCLLVIGAGAVAGADVLCATNASCTGKKLILASALADQRADTYLQRRRRAGSATSACAG
jgi:hypothetical protein